MEKANLCSFLLKPLFLFLEPYNRRIIFTKRPSFRQESLTPTLGILAKGSTIFAPSIVPLIRSVNFMDTRIPATGNSFGQGPGTIIGLSGPPGLLLFPTY